MLLANGDGTYTAGPLDVIGILKDASTGRFHACIWLEHPLPGGGPPSNIVRLKSKMHHTEGAATWEVALKHVQELCRKIVIDDDNVWIKPEQVVERDFSIAGYADVMIVPSWKKPSVVTLGCPFCGAEIVSHTPSSWSHTQPVCAKAQGFEFFDVLAEAVARAHGTTIESEKQRQLNSMVSS
jgi:hypothetical protein